MLNLRVIMCIVVSVVVLCIVGCDTVTTTTVEPYVSQPLYVSADFDGGKVIVAWEISEIGSELGYEIWRETRYGEAEYSKIGQTDKNVMSFNDTNIEIDKNYSYKVRGIFDGFEGEFSEDNDCTTTLEVPINLSAITYNDFIRFGWEQSGEMSAIIFEVWRSVDNPNNFELVRTVSGDILSYDDNDITGGNYYYYAVKAIYELGTSEMSSYVYVYFSK